MQARDAILQADLVNNGGANQAELWAAFAKRGLGLGATSPSSSTTAYVQESYDVPDTLRVGPVADFQPYGSAGGPFSPACASYFLTNVGSGALTWTATASQPWVRLNPSGGSVPAGGYATVNVCLTSPASNLAVGTYSAVVIFSNTASRKTFTRSVILDVMPPPVWTFALDSDPGWPRQGEWAFGRPTGQGGADYGNPDPTSGATGVNVFGINLNGDYLPLRRPACYLTAGPFDLSGYSGARLQFKRWLNSDYQPYVYDTIEVSRNGADWYRVWSNGYSAKGGRRLAPGLV